MFLLLSTAALAVSPWPGTANAATSHESSEQTPPSLCELAQAKLAQANGEKWLEVKNTEIGLGSRMGWSIETPSHWVAIPDVHPGWPIGAGYRSPSGTSGVVITWLANVPQNEYSALLSRNYHQAECRVGGFEATVFTRNSGKKLEKLYYVTRPGGTYRLSTFAPTSDGSSISHVVKSFSFVHGSNANADSLSCHGSTTQAAISDGSSGIPPGWKDYSRDKAGFALSYPEGLVLTETRTGFELSSQGKELVKAQVLPRTSVPGQSFRGYCRALGKESIANAQTLSKFNPYEIKTVTAYQAIWQTGSNSYVGPVIYYPLTKDANYGVLELTLINADEMNTFFRIVNSLRHTTE